MVSTLDKVILGTVGATIVGLSSGAGIYAVRMIGAEAPAAGSPGAEVAVLGGASGRVKTRHRETLAWTDARREQALREGDRIRTLADATAEIRYRHGVAFKLSPNSQVTVYGPVETAGERLIAINVVDGAIQAEVAAGETLSIRDATGTERGRLRSTDAGGARVVLTAPERTGGTIGLEVVRGTQVEVSDAGGNTQVVAEGQQGSVGTAVAAATPEPTPEPSPEPTRVAIARPTTTPKPPLLEGIGPLPIVRSDSGDVRFRLALPAGVVAAEVGGRKGVIVGNQIEFEVFGLKSGAHELDIVFTHEGGRKSRQVQAIRIR